MRYKIRGKLKTYKNAAVLWQAVSKAKDSGGSVCYKRSETPSPTADFPVSYFQSRKDLEALSFPVMVDESEDWDSTVVHSFYILNDIEISQVLRDLKKQVLFIEDFKSNKK